MDLECPALPPPVDHLSRPSHSSPSVSFGRLTWYKNFLKLAPGRPTSHQMVPEAQSIPLLLHVTGRAQLRESFWLPGAFTGWGTGDVDSDHVTKESVGKQNKALP